MSDPLEKWRKATATRIYKSHCTTLPPHRAAIVAAEYVGVPVAKVLEWVK